MEMVEIRVLWTIITPRQIVDWTKIEMRLEGAKTQYFTSSTTGIIHHELINQDPIMVKTWASFRAIPSSHNRTWTRHIDSIKTHLFKAKGTFTWGLKCRRSRQAILDCTRRTSKRITGLKVSYLITNSHFWKAMSTKSPAEMDPTTQCNEIKIK